MIRLLPVEAISISCTHSNEILRLPNKIFEVILVEMLFQNVLAP